jgi:predicted nucleotidyltransferase
MIQEQIIRSVTPVGNGAHILAPRGWVGDEVILVRKPKLTTREKILSVLDPHLEDIVGVYLFGSRARNEEEKDSDIDLFVITNKPLKIEEESFEIIAIEESKISNAIRLAPLVIYAILSESKPIINSHLLTKLKEKYKPKLGDFKEFLESSERVVKISEEFLESEEREYSESAELAYPIMLRLRGIFILNQLLAGESYSHKKFKSWIRKKNTNVDYEAVYGAYSGLKRETKLGKIRVSDLKEMVVLLKKEVLRLQMKLNGKKKKASSKGN